jgi:oligopeptide/dipeptide ABC transporter ATP-binding protein
MPTSSPAATSAAPLLELRRVSKTFEVRRPFRRERYVVKAVDRIDLQIGAGQAFGLVGESGCGKSTLARLILHLLPATGGQILFDGKDISSLSGPGLAALRREMQMVFQDPYSSLNPSFSIHAILREGLSKVPGLSRDEMERRARYLLATVGLTDEMLQVYPHQLSGGQKQRVGIARALTVEPRFLVADEPTSALDVSIQSQILNLFADLQARMQLTLLFISHDLSVIRYLCDEVAVMYLGQIVETGPAQQVLDWPCHPYTVALLTAIPRMDQRGTRERRIVPGELPGPLQQPTGCRFHPRCVFAQERCRREEPRLEDQGDGRRVACFFPVHHDA